MVSKTMEKYLKMVMIMIMTINILNSLSPFFHILLFEKYRDGFNILL